MSVALPHVYKCSRRPENRTGPLGNKLTRGFKSHYMVSGNLTWDSVKALFFRPKEGNLCNSSSPLVYRTVVLNLANAETI